MFIADFHIHSRYSRATSKDLAPETLAYWARRKGLGVIGTGDFTHPAWRAELAEKLISTGDGLYALKDSLRLPPDVANEGLEPAFVLSGEISSIYKKDGKVRKVHNVILLPSLEAAEALSKRLEAIGNLRSDGRPILGLDSRDLLEITLETCPEVIFIPAHIWTPHFSLFGAYSGFDDIQSCFGDLTGHIHALETGLSSDPPMNWRVSSLDRFTLVSNSDAHSPANLAREANLFDTERTYHHMADALKNPHTGAFVGTLEFFPEEGKYHNDGHRGCKVCLTPRETRAHDGVCPVCGGRVTVGVLHRVEALADREEGYTPPHAKPFESLVPLREVIASSMGVTTASAKVMRKYDEMLAAIGDELSILRAIPLEEIEGKAGLVVAECVRRLREGRVDIHPGYDGEYGKISLMSKQEMSMFIGQQSLFPAQIAERAQNVDTRNNARRYKAKDESPPAQGGVISQAAASPYGLNHEQWEAVSALEPVVAVVAGPGTGKTKTLAGRIVYLVERRGVPPAAITAVTFTNKAAREMRRRVAEELADKDAVRDMAIGTFHAICMRTLAKEGFGAIIAEPDAMQIAADILAEMKVKGSPRDVLRAISLRKSGVEGAEAAVSEAVYEAYCARLAAMRVLDYDDILLRALTLAESVGKSDSCARGAIGVMDGDGNRPLSLTPAERVRKSGSCALGAMGEMDGDGNRPLSLTPAERVRKSDSCALGAIGVMDGDGNRPLSLTPAGEVKTSGARAYLLVDEFQDINPVQFRLICAWVGGTGNLFVIGDPDQAIYGFRGSDARCFSRLYAYYPNARQINLRDNYRSTPEILRAAASLLPSKAAPLRPMNPPGCPAAVVEAGDAFQQALYITKEINALVGGVDMLDAHRKSAKRQARSLGEIAVLYRTNRQAGLLEECLTKEGIPYTVSGREDFLMEPQARLAMAFFRLLLNPGDILSLGVCLRGSERYGPEVIRRIIQAQMAAPGSVDALLTLLAAQTGEEPLPGIPSLKEMIAGYSPRVGREKPADLVNSWTRDNALSGLRCMELMRDTAVMYESMEDLLHNIALGRESDLTRSGSKRYTLDAVSLLTLHGAKGLEYPVVFLLGVDDGLIPLRGPKGDNDMEEERRLLYVGMTRAKETLTLVTSDAPSPFLSALPEGAVRRERRKRAPGAAQTRLF